MLTLPSAARLSFVPVNILQNSRRYANIAYHNTHNSYKFHTRRHRLIVNNASASSPSFENYENEPKKKTTYKSLAVAVGLPLTLGSITAALNPPDRWYFQLKKPQWTPPAPLFGFAWSLIYPLMGIASWLVWKNGFVTIEGIQKQEATGSLWLYGIQLVFNLLWQVFFFGFHNPALAFGDICLLLALIAWCTVTFKKHSPNASKLMVVYLLWVVFAAALNFNIWKMNA